MSVIVTVSVPGQGSETIPLSAYVLAPKVGQIKIGCYQVYESGGYSFLGWDTMTAGVVNGVNVANLIGASLAPQTALALDAPGLPLAQAPEAQTNPANSLEAAPASLEVVQASDGTSCLVLTGQPGVSYMIEARQTDGQETFWEPFWVGTLKEEQVALPIKPASGSRVYRVQAR